MGLTTRKLSVNLWSDSTPAYEQLVAQIYVLAPGARFASAITQNQLCIVLDDTDSSTVSALDALLQNDFEEVIFSYRWHVKGAIFA